MKTGTLVLIVWIALTNVIGVTLSENVSEITEDSVELVKIKMAMETERERDHKMQSDLENALSHMRMVVKNGIKVKGTYSYSDGQFRKTIYYIADNKGYRITGEDIVALSDTNPLRSYPDEDLDSGEMSQDDAHPTPT